MFTRNVHKVLMPRIFALGFLMLCFFSLPVSGQLVKDGSFEAVNLSGTATEGWRFCQGAPDVQILDGYGAGIFGINTPAADGQRYLGMVDATFEINEAIGQALLMEAGMHFYGSVALFRSRAHQSWNGTGQLQIWGSNDCSLRQELLWSSGTVANVDEWSYYPIEFTPTQNYRWMSIVVELDPGSGEMTYLCLDDLFLDNEFLAVDYLSFQAQPQGERIQLDWETAALVNAETFVVEWSTDGSAFAPVGQVAALAGQSQFTFAHTPTTSGLHYYRLKALDQSGNANLSEVRQTYWMAEAGIQVFPNPATDKISISSSAPIQAIHISDINGRIVHTVATKNTQFQQIDLPTHLRSGCYQLQIQTTNGTQSRRLVVQR